MSDSYIFVQLMGGMGNQLFQYAAGLLQMNITNGTLYLCKAVENIHDTTDYRNLLSSSIKYDDNLPSYISLNQSHAFSNWNPQEYKYPIVYLHGYFQNYSTLKPILPEFRNNILKSLKPYNSSLEKYNSAFIHIRRGDYLEKSDIHHVIDMSYYTKAVDIITSSKKIDLWYIFSDDLEWVKNQPYFSTIHSTFVDEKDPVKSLAIMSQIHDGAIIANSTFSWMGAYLGIGEKEKSVVYPKKWFNNTTPDLFPSEWIGI